MKLPCLLNGRPPTARLERRILEALPGGQTAAASGAAALAPTSVNHCVDVTDDSPTERKAGASGAPSPSPLPSPSALASPFPSPWLCLSVCRLPLPRPSPTHRSRPRAHLAGGHRVLWEVGAPRHAVAFFVWPRCLSCTRGPSIVVPRLGSLFGPRNGNRSGSILWTLRSPIRGPF